MHKTTFSIIHEHKYQVGDTLVFNRQWTGGPWMKTIDEITFDGRYRFKDPLLSAAASFEAIATVDADDNVHLRQAPLPERWWQVSLSAGTAGFSSTRPIDDRLVTAGDTVIVHIWTDDNGVDHAEVTRA